MNGLLITYYIQDIFTSLMISSSVIVSMRFLKFFEDDAGDEFEIGKVFGFCFFGGLRTTKGYFVELGAFLLW